jgi:hypothetical protein
MSADDFFLTWLREFFRGPTFRAEPLRPARYLCKIAYQRGGPKSARAPSWTARAYYAAGAFLVAINSWCPNCTIE